MSQLEISKTTFCPYCDRPVSPYSGQVKCSHCQRHVFQYPCPKCGRLTLNLTLFKRYGKANCFICGHEIDQLPDEHGIATKPLPKKAAPAATPASPSGYVAQQTRPLQASVTPRSPKAPIMPTAEEARVVIEHCLVGLERAGQDRDMLWDPDLRAVVTQFLDTVQMALTLDTAMAKEEITSNWLLDQANLALLARHCFTPLWPSEGVLLPASVQVWVLAVDDAVRRWQYARRCWLAEYCGLTMMPTVPSVTAPDPERHDVTGTGPVITEVIEPGFIMREIVLRRAKVRA